MNIRKKIVLALTVRLLNARATGNILGIVREVMHGFQEAGSFLGQTVTGQLDLNDQRSVETIALRYENCTLNLNLVSDRDRSNQMVHGFRIQ